MTAIAVCARCGVVGVLQAPKPPWCVNDEWWIAMSMRCGCRIRTTTHKLDAPAAREDARKVSVTFESCERAAQEARESWNALQSADSAQ